MIAFLNGTVLQAREGRVVLEVGSMGYEIWVPSGIKYEAAVKGRNLRLYTHLQVTDSSMELFGFLTPEEKELFLLITSISSFGAKLALAILSALSPSELAYAVIGNEKKVLRQVPGLGEKKAGRLILELKDNQNLMKMLLENTAGGVPGAAEESAYASEVAAALESFGCSPSEAALVTRQAAAESQQRNFDAVLARALDILGGRE